MESQTRQDDHPPFGPLEVQTTEDGSSTLYDPVLDAHYRSTHGAHTESTLVFLEGSRLHRRPPPWFVVELGFGTARNFLTTAAHFRHRYPEGQLHYHTIDWRPIPPETFRSLQPTPPPEDAHLVEQILQKHQEKPARTHQLQSHDQRIQLTLHACPWKEVQLPTHFAHAVYHDPFGPRINPTSWGPDCFAWAFNLLQSGGILATYSAAAAVRSAMALVGFSIATSPGPGRKKEITLASPDPAALQPLPLLSQEKYKDKARGYFPEWPSSLPSLLPQGETST